MNAKIDTLDMGSWNEAPARNEWRSIYSCQCGCQLFYVGLPGGWETAIECSDCGARAVVHDG